MLTGKILATCVALSLSMLLGVEARPAGVVKRNALDVQERVPVEEHGAELPAALGNIVGELSGFLPGVIKRGTADSVQEREPLMEIVDDLDGVVVGLVDELGNVVGGVVGGLGVRENELQG